MQVRDTADVAAAVRWANRFDVRLVARSGGHSYAGYCTTGDGVVLDLSRLRGIRVSRGRATVGPAAQLIDVQRALTRRGVTVPSGSCPTRRHRRARPGRRPRSRRAPLRPDERQPARGARRDRRRPRSPRGRRHERGPLLGAPRRRWRQLRDRHGADAPDAPGRGRRVLLRVLAVVAGRRGARGLAAVRARGAARAHLDPLAGHDGRGRQPARVGARPVLRRGVRAPSPGATADAGGRGEAQHRQLELLHDGAALGGLPRRRPAGVPPLDALELLREVRLLRQADRPARPRADDRLDRAPPADALARLGRAAPRRVWWRAEPAGGRRHGVRPPRHALLAPVPRLLQWRGRGPGEQALDQRHVAGAPAARLRRGVPELHRPGPRSLAARVLRRESRRGCARSRSRSIPTSASASPRRSRPRR